MLNPKAVLLISALALKVKLGVSAKEKKRKQVVLLDLKFAFTKRPNGSNSDNIIDTICYDEVIAAVKKYLLNKEFNLIEFLTLQLFQFLKKEYFSRGKLELKLTKQPQIKSLSSVSFIISDN